MASRITSLIVCIVVLAMGGGMAHASQAPARAAKPEVAHKCVNDTGAPCKTAKQYRRAFKDGDLGSTSAAKSEFSSRFKKKMRRAAVRQGLIPPPAAASRQMMRSSYKFDSWGDLWDAFNNALDCVAPGAESACREDISKVKALRKPSKVVIGCGGIAVMSYFSAGTAGPVAAAVAGGSICSWGMAIDAW